MLGSYSGEYCYNIINGVVHGKAPEYLCDLISRTRTENFSKSLYMWKYSRYITLVDTNTLYLGMVKDIFCATI